MKNRILSAAGAAILLAAGCGGAPDTEMADNPFFEESALPYRLPPFDLIEDRHYRPAFERGMAEQIEEVEAIAASAEPPGFENTLVALERSGRLLDRVARVFFSLAAADTNDEMNAIRAEMAPKLAAHSDRILLNPDLFARVEAIHERRASSGLSPEEIRLVERYRRDFTRAGARLDEPEKERMREINAELATLSAAFTEKTLDEVNASAVVVDSPRNSPGSPPARSQPPPRRRRPAASKANMCSRCSTPAASRRSPRWKTAPSGNGSCGLRSPAAAGAASTTTGR